MCVTLGGTSESEDRTVVRLLSCTHRKLCLNHPRPDKPDKTCPNQSTMHSTMVSPSNIRWGLIIFRSVIIQPGCVFFFFFFYWTHNNLVRKVCCCYLKEQERWQSDGSIARKNREKWFHPRRQKSRLKPRKCQNLWHIRNCTKLRTSYPTGVQAAWGFHGNRHTFASLESSPSHGQT